MPCTHPMGEIRDFKVEELSGSIYVISGGGEGMAHAWLYNPTSSTFGHAVAFDSHMRGVTAILLNG